MTQKPLKPPHIKPLTMPKPQPKPLGIKNDSFGFSLESLQVVKTIA
jgi:hypothetical protein